MINHSFFFFPFFPPPTATVIARLGHHPSARPPWPGVQRAKHPAIPGPPAHPQPAQGDPATPALHPGN